MFEQKYGHCDLHGQYPLNMLDENGIERWFPQGCPVCRRQKSIDKLLERSNIPARLAGCSFDNYVVSNPQQQKALDKCREYAADFGNRLKDGASLVMVGRPGTGKTHLSVAIMRAIVLAGHTALRVNATQYLHAYWAKGFGEREAWVQEMAAVDLLLIDEVGRASDTAASQNAMFHLINARYESMRPCVLTTNLNRDGLINSLGDAAYDRLAHGGIRLTLDWESCRTAPPET